VEDPKIRVATYNPGEIMEKLKMWINGIGVDAGSGKTFRTYNPANGDVVAEVPLAGKSDVDKAVAAARKAFPAWYRKTQEERSSYVTRIAAALREHKNELIKLEIAEHGATANCKTLLISILLAVM
jgi:acyl-CoA reductase-like NAD-dependent aldehyde dehydrogenase